MIDYRIEPFAEEHAQTILTWVESPEDREAWASRADLELTATLFRDWHSDPDVHPYVLTENGRLCAYGEVWTDDAAAEAELAHLVVAPEARGRGIGRRLVALLSRRARELGFEEIWVRVLSTNEAALATYAAAGFVRAAPEQEAGFNAGQPHSYVWMRLAEGPI